MPTRRPAGQLVSWSAEQAKFYRMQRCTSRRARRCATQPLSTKRCCWAVNTPCGIRGPALVPHLGIRQVLDLGLLASPFSPPNRPKETGGGRTKGWVSNPACQGLPVYRHCIEAISERFGKRQRGPQGLMRAFRLRIRLEKVTRCGDLDEWSALSRRFFQDESKVSSHAEMATIGFVIQVLQD